MAESQWSCAGGRFGARPRAGWGRARAGEPSSTPGRQREGERTGRDGHAGHEVVANSPEKGLELESVGREAVDAERRGDGQGQERDPLDIVEQGSERDGREDRLLVERCLNVVVRNSEVDRLARRLGLGEGRDERVCGKEDERRVRIPIRPEWRQTSGDDRDPSARLTAARSAKESD